MSKTKVSELSMTGQNTPFILLLLTRGLFFSPGSDKGDEPVESCESC